MIRFTVGLLLLFAFPVLGEAESGSELFDHRCGLCHREGGPGTFMLERRLGEGLAILEERGALSEAYIRQVVRWGVGSMPRFSRGEISDPELALISDYLTQPVDQD